MLPKSSRAVALAALACSACYVGVSEDGGTGPASDTDAAATTGPGSAGSASTVAPPPTGDPQDTDGPDPGATTEALTGGGPPSGPTSSPPDTGDDATGLPSTTGPGDMSTGPAPDDTGDPPPPDDTGDPPPPDGPAEMICQRWNADRADLSEGAWSGAVDGCNKGDVAAPGRPNALRLINLYRFLAGLPAVAEDAGASGKAQACALMMHANNSLSHSPPMNWACWSADGSESAGKSNISTTPGVVGVDLYMVDPGNPTTIGHRRWILSNSLGPVGLGSTSDYSCMQVIGGQGNAGKPWTAWPPEGIVPYEAIHVPEIGWTHVDETGWTIQSDGIDLGQATVSITEGGADRPVQVTKLGGGYGSAHAISMVPQGWATEPGKTYTVSVGGVAQPWSYQVQVVACE